jgi:general secretion pathway protein E
LCTILRQDPDVIMVGEIRDAETARYAVQAALTGHLVLTTLHTNDALAAVGRLLDLEVDRFFLAQVLRGLTAQRLVRKICPECSITEEMNVTTAGSLGLDSIPEGATISHGEGCEYCRGTGYIGRTTINEVVVIEPSVAAAIHNGCSHAQLIEVARKTGYRTLRESAVQAVLKGTTSVEEALRILSGAVA